MSEIREIKVESPYGSEDAVLELKIDTIDDGYILENVAKLVGDYNFSIWIKSVNKNCNVTFNILGLPVTETITTEWKKLSKVVTMNNINLNDIIIAPELNSTVYLYEGFLSEGNLDNSWIPAPEDTDTQMTSIRSEFVQTAEQIRGEIKDTDGRVSSLTQTVNGFVGRIEGVEGRVTKVEATANGLVTSVADANKNISTLQQNATKLESDIKSNTGEISNIKQEAGKLTTRVSNTEGSISTLTQKAGELETSISNAKNDISKIKQQADRVEITVGTSVQETTEEFYQSTSATALVGGKWETTQPPWTQGKYIWRRTKIKNGNKDVFYTPNEYGVCITGNTGATGATGTNGVGIKTIENFYLAHTSQTGVTHDTPNWSKTPQNMDSTNRYLWNYELITYDNGSTSKSKPCVIGMYGSTGKDGRGIESIEEFYQKSSSNTTAPVTWSKTVPTLTPTEKYLWNYEKTTYTDKSTNETKKRVIGVYGDKGQTGANGKDGKGILSTKIEYQAGTSGTTAPNGNWGTTIPSVAQGQYLWSKTTITYTDKSTSTSYSVAYIPKNGQNGANGQNGLDGKPGATGTGVGSIVQEYYMSTSKTTQVGSSWQTSMPTWSAGKYLWTRYKITYTNPTSTSWTSPICDSSWEAVNEVQVGGRNLALNSNSLIQTKEHLMSTYGISPSEGKKLDAPKAESAPVIYGHLVDGETYTISICLKPSPQMTSVEARVSGGKSVLCKLETKGTEKQTLSKTVTCKYAVGATPSDNQVNAFVDFYRMPNSSGTAYGDATIYWVKIERGNKATDWSPAPEDVENKVNGAQSDANQALEQVGKASAEITILKGSIKNLVTDKNGSSLMTQTGNGWTFDFSPVQEQINKAVNSAIKSGNVAEEAKNIAQNTDILANDIAKKTAYINMTTDDKHRPVLELGKQDNPFKVRITNEAIEFMEGSNRIAYITNQKLYIQSSVVTDQMQIGDNIDGFAWKKRENGNLGLRRVKNT